jgi:hypothetical protein
VIVSEGRLMTNNSMADIKEKRERIAIRCNSEGMLSVINDITLDLLSLLELDIHHHEWHEH